MVKAISPHEAIKAQLTAIGLGKAVEIINKILERQAAQLNYPNGTIIVMRDEVIIELAKHDITQADIERERLLDIIPLYEAQGWIVKFNGSDRISWSFSRLMN